MTNAGAVSTARPVALITGASAGIGQEFGLRLPERGYDVVLVARRRDRLDELAANVRALHGVRVEVLVADLSAADAVAGVVTAVAALGLQVDLLINNAGFGTHGRFETLENQRERDEIAVNVSALVALTHAFLPGMLERKRGGIINVASTASFQPVPYMAVYGGTKAFVRSFSQALHVEVRSRGVKVLALCPGATATEFFAGDVAAVPGPMRTSRDVVTTALAAYDRGRSVVIDGTPNNILILFSRLLPTAWAATVGGMLMRPR